MKYGNFNNLIPILSGGLIISAAYLYEFSKTSNDNVKLDYKFLPNFINHEILVNKSDNDLIVLDLKDGYDIIYKDDIENIIYSDDKLYVTIKLKNNEIYYNGYYDVSMACYKYDKINNTKKYVKK